MVLGAEKYTHPMVGTGYVYLNPGVPLHLPLLYIHLTLAHAHTFLSIDSYDRTFSFVTMQPRNKLHHGEMY